MIGKNVILGKNAEIGDNVILEDGAIIGNDVIVEGNVRIGKDTRIDHRCIIRGHVDIGERNWIYPYCVIGTGPEHLKHLEKSPEETAQKKGKIIIGDDNVIREFTDIHMPSKDGNTVIGSHCYIQIRSHIAHDDKIGNHVIMSCRAILGGHVEIDDYANIGMDATIHQHCNIGKYAMVGMKSPILKDVYPFAVIIQQDFTKINKPGLEKEGISKEDIEGIDRMYENGIERTSADKWYRKEYDNFVKKTWRKRFYTKEKA